MTHDKPVSMIAPCTADFVPFPATEGRNRGAAVNIYPLRVNSLSPHIFASVCFRFILSLSSRPVACSKPAVPVFLRIADAGFSLAAVPRLA